MSTFEGGTINTAADSSTAGTATDQGVATQDTAAQAQGQQAADPYADTSNLPWNNDPRFQQFINDRKELADLRQAAEASKTFEPYQPFIERLKADGIESWQQFEEKMSRQSAEQAEQTRISQALTGKAADLQRQIDAGDIDKATAARLYDLEAQTLTLQADRARDAERLAAVEIDRLLTKPEYAKMDVDDVLFRARTDKSKTLAQHALESHERESRKAANYIAQYNTDKSTDRSQTQQTPTNGSAAPSNTGMPPTDPKEFEKWMSSTIAANGGYGK